jgi:Ca2+/H+ antiporter, TMEM165/GDT1 family
MLNRRQYLVSVIFLGLLVISGGKDWFDLTDANHDGMIDRSEYTIGLDKFLNGLSDIDKSSSSSSSKLFESLMDMKGFWKGFTSSLAMILATEVGDKTFFIAAVLSMKHDRSAVLIGAFLALIVMTILSTAMGLVLPRFMDKKYTHILSGILFLYFGVKLILDSRGMEGGKVSEELEEVEEELLQQGSKKKGDDEELGQQQRSAKSGSKMSSTTSYTSIIITSLTLTFVAEWGDRSQIATIALASAKNPIGVTIGCLIGHAICTSAACIGGRMLASSISEKTVSLWGGVVFLLFGIHSLFFETSAEAAASSSTSSP